MRCKKSKMCDPAQVSGWRDFAAGMLVTILSAHTIAWGRWQSQKPICIRSVANVVSVLALDLFVGWHNPFSSQDSRDSVVVKQMSFTNSWGKKNKTNSWRQIAITCIVEMDLWAAHSYIKTCISQPVHKKSAIPNQLGTLVQFSPFRIAIK